MVFDWLFGLGIKESDPLAVEKLTQRADVAGWLLALGGIALCLSFWSARFRLDLRWDEIVGYALLAGFLARAIASTHALRWKPPSNLELTLQPKSGKGLWAQSLVKAFFLTLWAVSLVALGFSLSANR